MTHAEPGGGSGRERHPLDSVPARRLLTETGDDAILDLVALDLGAASAGE
jgi:hypothetical protein